jgi:hypothetical protein
VTAVQRPPRGRAELDRERLLARARRAFVCDPMRTCLTRLGQCLDSKRLETNAVTAIFDGPAGVVTEPRRTTPF